MVEWVAALGIGGGQCVDRELDGWIDHAPVVEAARQDLEQWLIDALIEHYEQGTGLSVNTEAVEVGEEYWTPLVERVVDAQWSELRGPALGWFAERLSCRRAWRLAHERTTLDDATAEAFSAYWHAALAEPARHDALREQVGQLFDDWGDTFSAEVREVLPGPPNAAEPR